MREEVYEYLHDYGFSAIELDKIENENEEMFSTSISEVRKNITFLEDKHLDIEDIITIINANPYMLTEKDNRLEALEYIYDKVLQFDYEAMINLIKTNPEIYTISPIELKKIIDFLISKNFTINSIKDLIINNPKIISMKVEDFKEIIRIN